MVREVETVSLFFYVEPKVLKRRFSIHALASKIETLRGVTEGPASTAAAGTYQTVDGVAHIGVRGLLVSSRSMWGWLFGETETVYTDICEATLAADADPAVREVYYHVDSNGGMVDDCDFAAQVIAETQKPTTAIVGANAASGAYYLISGCDQVLAQSRGSMIGSIGVVCSITDYSGMNERSGIKEYEIVNQRSQNKRPKPSTEEGYAVFQEQADELYDVFENRVVEGRSPHVEGFSAENIRKLAGKVVTARRALEAGLIDGIIHDKRSNKTNREDTRMTLQEVFAQHPEVKQEHDALVAQMTSNTKAEADQAATTAVSNTLGIFTAAGIQVSDNVREAAEKRTPAGDFALAVLQAKAKPPQPNAQALGGVKPAPQPKDSAPSGKQEAVEAQSDQLIEAMGGSKRAV